MVDLLDLPDYEDSPQLADAYDELSLWSAPFGLLLLHHLPLRRGMRVLDLGCGTGFPLLELAQRLGRSCFAVGVDPWSNAMRRAERKRSTHRVENAAVVLRRVRQAVSVRESLQSATRRGGTRAPVRGP